MTTVKTPTSAETILTAANDNPGGSRTLDPLTIRFVTIMARAHAAELKDKERLQ